MLSQQVAQTQQEIYNSLTHLHLQRAFDLLHTLTSQLQSWDTDEKLHEIETSYRYMTQYVLDGVKDPGRGQVYNRLISQTYLLTDTVCEKLLTRNSNTLYYSKKRYLDTSGKTLAQAYTSLDNNINELSLSELLMGNSDTTGKRKAVELQAIDFFDRVWTNFPGHTDDYATLRNALQSRHLPEPIAAIVVTALTLNIAHCFDEEKAHILIETYVHNDSTEVQMRALCGLLTTIMRHHTRIVLCDKLSSRLSLLYDVAQFRTDTRNILMQFIRSRDTEKIARKLNEELLPKMMKISPELYKKIKEDDALSDIESLEHNPEWQEILHQSGISDNLMEINDLQMQGADVFMSTFAHLKNFPFFNELSNWFIPFMPHHSAVAEITGSEGWGKQFAEILTATGFLCNSDKYSFALSLTQVPQAQRQMMASQFGNENAAMNEDAKSQLMQQSRERENISNRYLQDLYRFSKLHPRRSEFNDTFSLSIEKLFDTQEFAPILQDEKLLKSLGEYLFAHQYYTDALYILDKLTATHYTESDLFQKIAYCYQSLGQYQEALEYYLKADLIKPNHVWTLRRIATCYRNIKKSNKALEYYMRADELSPDNISVNLNIGNCYLEQKKYDEALRYYFKVDFLDSKGTKARRPIAWCSFLAGKYEQAMGVYKKILDSNATSLDYINAGHVQLAMAHTRQAIELYLTAIKTDQGDIDNFTKVFTQDIPDLINAGISEEDIPIIYDYVTHQAKTAQ